MIHNNFGATDSFWRHGQEEYIGENSISLSLFRDGRNWSFQEYKNKRWLPRID